MKYLSITGLAAAALLAGVSAATAQEAVTTSDVNMRAGPGTRFPVVTTIPENRPVMIHGCLNDFDWCDVSWRYERGWVFSDYLDYLYNERPVTFYEYRRRVNVPVVSFGFGYWDRHYRQRPWFDDWDRWGGSIRWSDRNRRDRNWDDRDRNDRNWNDRDRDDDFDGNNRNRQQSRDRRDGGMNDDDDSSVIIRNRQQSRERFDDGDDNQDGRRRDRVNRDRCDDGSMDPACQSGSDFVPRSRDRNRQNSNDVNDSQ
jgi:uncharacterized protein YraI